MKPRPFGARVEGGILWLTLDTPGCDVNVFGQEAASQLLESLEPVGRGDVRAVVVRSGKPGSFVNGAGLLMANTAQRPEDAGIATATIRRAYRALRELPVPVVAAIQGNCYGCGVEFSLHAAYRVAERSQDTHFYMTEIADYLFLPTFGSTQDLPRVVGLDNAVDFLLWGVRWTADEAKARGLVDVCFDADEFDAGVRAFVAEILSGKRTIGGPRANPDVASTVSKANGRIALLPPMYRDLYREALDLLVRAAEGPRNPAGYAEEIAACGRSLMNPMAKSALSTFFVRQLAKAVSLRGAGTAIRTVDVIGVPPLFGDLVARRVRNMRVVSADADAGAPDLLRILAYGAPGRMDDVAALLSPLRTPIEWSSRVIAYAPLFETGNRLVEIAGLPTATNVATVVDVLTRSGYTAVASRPNRRFVIDGMSEAFFDPIRGFVEQGGRPETVARTLRDFGFVQTPATLAHLLRVDLDLPEADAEAGVFDEALRDAILTSLLGFAAGALGTGTVAHPSVLDVMARELLDFPLAHATLCKYLSGNLPRELLARSSTFAHYVAKPALDLAERHASTGKPFYR